MEADLAAPLISIVVPTSGRPESLRRCLRSLALQEPRDAIEIVAVDDGSDDAGAVHATAEAAGARLVRQERLGPGAARNAGARVARAPVVCFIDDDCEALPRWAEALAAALHDGAAAAAGATRGAGGPWSHGAELVIAYAGGNSSEPFAPSNNVAVRRDVFASVQFDPRFGPGAGGEDRDWCCRLAESGVAIRRVPDAVVVHHQAQTFRRFWRQHVRYGRSAFRYRRGRRLERAAFYAGLLRAGLDGGPLIAAVVCLAQVATAAGFAAEALSARAGAVLRRPDRAR